MTGGTHSMSDLEVSHALPISFILNHYNNFLIQAEGLFSYIKSFLRQKSHLAPEFGPNLVKVGSKLDPFSKEETFM